MWCGDLQSGIVLKIKGIEMSFMLNLLQRRRFGAQMICACTLLSAGCSSVMTISDAEPVPSSQCRVKVFLTKDQALRKGEIEELCVISGSSSGSFVHTPEAAINKHKDKACKCGGTNVYVRSEAPSGGGVATASMVAFKFVDQVD